MKNMTRRSAIGAIAMSASLVYAREKGNTFALIGDRYHNSDYIRTSLGKTLGEGAGLKIDFYDEVKLLNAEELQGYRMLVILRDGMTWPDGYGRGGGGGRGGRTGGATKGGGGGRAAAPEIVSDPPLPDWGGEAHYWITPEQGKAVKDFVSRGGSALFYHNVGYISPHNDDFRDVFGAVTQGHPALRPFKVKIVNKDHPITRGVNDFIVTDEQHFLEYQKDPKYLLMQSVNEDGLTHQRQGKDLGTTSAAGWAYDYGKGRVCYLAPGHVMTSLWNPEYVKIQKNAVRWLLREI